MKLKSSNYRNLQIPNNNKTVFNQSWSNNVINVFSNVAYLNNTFAYYHYSYSLVLLLHNKIKLGLECIEDYKS